MEGSERLDKFLARQKGLSRREAAALIRKGAVAVNGLPQTRPEEKIEPLHDRVAVNGEEIVYRKYLYLMMNKPEGVLCATEDPKTPTVLSLVPPAWRRKDLAPAGRLDKNTTGLLLLTDDGEFTHRMLAPKSHVYKLYEALLDGELTPEDQEAFAAGIETETAKFLPAECFLPDKSDPCRARVRIREGKYHQVKRMFASRGKQVLQLTRLQIGALPLDPNLQPGECRILEPLEVEEIFL